LTEHIFIDEKYVVEYNGIEVNIDSLWGRVKFPTDGKVHEPYACIRPIRCNSETDGKVRMGKGWLIWNADA